MILFGRRRNRAYTLATDRIRELERKLALTPDQAKVLQAFETHRVFTCLPEISAAALVVSVQEAVNELLKRQLVVQTTHKGYSLYKFTGI